jgi:eukaryotic-like serine/threonine-protein kinase
VWKNARNGWRSHPVILVQPLPGPDGRIQISKAPGSQARWSRDGRTLFYMQHDKKLMAAGFDPQTGSASAPQMVFQTRIAASGYAFFQYAVSADGRFLINSVPSNYSSPLTLITGWTAQARR